ncbi:DUF2945 domain-containing protein [Pseudooceanicola aestuarii]|uniref:DUF2945 domain-containing protein n=1 Tax=Pseudooceanicola aestuarii TaxID=2697319 RepID=UPI001EF87995|nr:DUF2945 domain-containing protein [Pseudooceanicola aestuarii]
MTSPGGAGRVSGRDTKVHEADFDRKGYRRPASTEAPHYEIESDETEPIAEHKEDRLTALDE